MILRARAEHAMTIVENLNEFSKRELELVRGSQDRAVPIVTELERSVVAYAGVYDGRVGAVWGVYGTSLVAGHGYLWMLTSTLANEYPFIFARHSQLAIATLAEMFPTLTCYVDPEYKRSVKWLKWLGFELGETEMVNGVRLRKAVRRA